MHRALAVLGSLIGATPAAAAAAMHVRNERSKKDESPEKGKSRRTQGFSRVAETLVPWQPLARFHRDQAPRRLPPTEITHAGYTQGPPSLEHSFDDSILKYSET